LIRETWEKGGIVYCGGEGVRWGKIRESPEKSSVKTPAPQRSAGGSIFSPMYEGGGEVSSNSLLEGKGL